MSRPPQYAFFFRCHYSKSCVFVHSCAHFFVSTSLPFVFLGQQFFVGMANFDMELSGHVTQPSYVPVWFEAWWFFPGHVFMLFPFILRSVPACQQIQTRISSFRDAFSSNGSFWFQMSRNNPNRFVFQSILTFFLVFCVLNCTHALNKNCIHAPNKRTPVRFVRNVPQQSQSLRFSIHFEVFFGLF